jgi:peptidoglycan hydrolase CwlO-like protein
MSTKKRVFKKLAEETKVELSAQKVELGSTDIFDIRNGARNAHDSLMTESNQELSKAKRAIAKILKNLVTGVKKLDVFENELNSKIKRNKKLAEEIGVDIANTSVGKNMTKAKGEIDDLKKSLNRKIKNVSSIDF